MTYRSVGARTPPNPSKDSMPQGRTNSALSGTYGLPVATGNRAGRG